MSSHGSSSTAKPRRYALQKGEKKGFVTFSDGTKIWVELIPFVSALVNQESSEVIVDVCVRAAYDQDCNWVRICSFFHPTTIKDNGKRVMDSRGHHVVVDMQNSSIPGKAEKAHIYVSGFEPIKNGTLPKPGTKYLPGKQWYDDVFFQYVRWETDRTGSSQGASIPSGNNTPSSTHSGGKDKFKSPAYRNDFAATAASLTQQWIAFPNDWYKREQFYDGQAYVPGRLRHPDGRGGYVYSDANGEFPDAGASGSQQPSGSQPATTATDRDHRAASASSVQSQWVSIGNGEERYFSASRNDYINKYRRRDQRGQWEEYSLRTR